MRTLLAWFFYILGVIFFVLILAGGYFYVTDPLGLREIVPLLMEQQEMSAPKVEEKVSGVQKETSTEKVPDKNPVLTAPQEAALESVGINPAALPTTVSDTQKTCLINAVGETRADEIKAGALPTVAEIVKAKSCF